MALIKNPKSDLKGKYEKFFEISLIISLSLFIAAFNYFPQLKPEKVSIQAPQELFTVEDIQSTNQFKRPPPPPKPPIPVEAPSNVVLQDININSNELNPDKLVPPPPPPKLNNISNEENYYYPIPEVLPEPIGGMAAIQRKIVYPEIAKRAGIEGRVIVKAFIDENGNVNKVEVVKGIGAGCDKAALKAVKETKFKPGKQREKPVKVQVMIPVVFKLK
jgi:periplasmic protein TonB